MPDPGELWFAGEPGTLLVFRVNRRPWSDQNLFTPEIPPDPYEHFVRMLTPGYEVVTGRRNQRVWRAGGVRADDDARMVTGKLGWEPIGREAIPLWDATEKDWTSETATPHGGRVVPFAFDGETRLLAVLRDRKTPPTTTAAVFEQILRDNERELEHPTTEWSVEPVLDAADFLAWLETLDTVHVVSFTAKLPNPEPRGAYRDLGERIRGLHATSYTETLRSDRDEGLIGVQDDPEVQQAIAMAKNGQANLRGEGRRGESVSQYSQSNRVAKERVDEVPDNWNDVWSLMKIYLGGRLRRFMRQDHTSA